MPSERLTQLKHKSLESLKQTYKQRLETILNKQLTVDNIGTFADEALSETVQLTEDILIEYRRNPEVHARPTTLSPREQEDEAFTILSLPNISEVLQSINKVKDNISFLKTYIHTNSESIDTVITPPQPDHITEVKEGTGSFEKRMFPRLLTLLYILEHDFNLPPIEAHITQGIVIPKMMRRIPYVRVEIPAQNRVIYICDEEGNVSYVFDTTRLREVGLTLEEVDVDDKKDKNSLIAYYPGIGIKIIQSKNWRRNIAIALGKEIPKVETGIPEEHEAEERERASEFKESGEFLSFDKFQSEVRSLYPGQGDISDWYHKERKKHSNWTSSPQRTYKNKGWEGFPELVGRMLPSFLEFQSEVRSLYAGQENVARWFYEEEKKKHPNWPSDPGSKYKDEGWMGWSELVNKVNPTEKVWLTFNDFQAEVKSLYPGQGSVSDWYKVEKKKHPNWPSSPDLVYKDKGWIGWPEFMGRENILKREFLPFEKFRTEVRSLYPGQGSVSSWYRPEKKKHPNWPSDPYIMYKDSGWTNWADFMGRENPNERGFLSFGDFQDSVRSLYSGEGNVQRWYHRERKNHKDWPSAPHQTYKDKGWIDWSEFVGKENRLKKVFPSFLDFQTEVKSLYPGQGDVQKWHYDERKNHKNWPVEPRRFYEDGGWIGWSELVGRENPMKKKWLSFIDFQVEVRNLYPGKGNVARWYEKEYKYHTYWPSEPDEMYKDRGWIGWPELVGRKNMFKMELLPFGDFQNEVRSFYSGQTDVYAWYRGERINHKSWPGNPDTIYENRGWTGWSELVGRENPTKKEFISFNVFQAEVRSLYPGKVPIMKWYYKERENHKNWPSAPHQIYKDEGWVSWLDLFGKKKAE